MELDKNKLLSFNAYYQIMTLPSFNSLDDMIKNHILISCSSFQNEIDDILYKLQGIQKILLQPLNEFYEYLKDVEAKVEGLKKCVLIVNFLNNLMKMFSARGKG